MNLHLLSRRFRARGGAPICASGYARPSYLSREYADARDGGDRFPSAKRTDVHGFLVALTERGTCGAMEVGGSALRALRLEAEHRRCAGGWRIVPRSLHLRLEAEHRRCDRGWRIVPRSLHSRLEAAATQSVVRGQLCVDRWQIGFVQQPAAVFPFPIAHHPLRSRHRDTERRVILPDREIRSGKSASPSTGSGRA